MELINMDNISNLSKVELQRFCKERGLSVGKTATKLTLQLALRVDGPEEEKVDFEEEEILATGPKLQQPEEEDTFFTRVQPPGRAGSCVPAYNLSQEEPVTGKMKGSSGSR
ncbi:hypothetical protein NDU88_001874 [Pleurodeles waltl]|uniref:SAP domain-containing protein n=1 Tax=Pleurodeles waltl TaxID=8319 RepID=A0AAV7SE14_PLEWA|nr:hypothetical protein NDU88_001874 [Pleurodeles waltl]